MSKSQRVSSEFEREVRKILNARYQNGKAKLNMREMGLPEGTRLILNTPSWHKVVEEAKDMPRRIRK